MTRLAARIGMWAAICEAIFTLVYILGLIFLVSSTLSHQSVLEAASQGWTNIQDYAGHYLDDPLSVAAGLAVEVDVFLTGLAILVIFLVLHEMAAPPLKIITRISSALALVVAVTSCTVYYIQIASVHQAILQGGDLEGLAQFAESNAISPAIATLQMSWALFYGLTTLAATPISRGSGLQKWIRVGFLINGVIGVFVGIFYALGISWVMLVSIVGLIATSFAYPRLAILFRRAARSDKTYLFEPAI